MNAKDTKTLVIKSSEWGRAAYEPNKKENLAAGVLCNKDNGKMCCLGILGRDCGVPLSNMYGVGMPEDLVDQDDPDALGFPDWVFRVFRTESDTEEDDEGIEYEGEERTVNSRLAENLAEINDSILTTDEEKIGKITEELRTVGWNVQYLADE